MASADMASFFLPFCTSHLGDSGKQNTPRQMKTQKTNGSDRGNLQLTELVWRKERPTLTRAAISMPLATKVPRTTTFFPRFFGLEHSACQTGTTALTPPTPIPDTMRPTMSCPSVKLVPWRMMPIAAMAAKIMSERLRPSGLPIDVEGKAPTRHPMVYIATTVPEEVRSVEYLRGFEKI